MATVLCFGDSNTYGTPPMQHETDQARFGDGERWPRVLAHDLGTGHHVIEEGLPGRTVCNDDHIKGMAWNGLRMLPAILASHAPIDVLVVMLGTNDFQHRFAMTGQEVAIALMRMAEQVNLYGQVKQQLYVIPTPIREEGLFAELFMGAERREARLEAHMHRLLPDMGAEVMSAAPHASVDPVDGVHFGVEGHQRLGRAVAAKVRGMLIHAA